jgi:hypothetical protein
MCEEQGGGGRLILRDRARIDLCAASWQPNAGGSVIDLLHILMIREGLAHWLAAHPARR